MTLTSNVNVTMHHRDVISTLKNDAIKTLFTGFNKSLLESKNSLRGKKIDSEVPKIVSWGKKPTELQFIELKKI